MSDKHLIDFVARRLNDGLSEISPANLTRLGAARRAALAHQPSQKTGWLAGVQGMFHMDIFARRALIRATALMVLAIGTAYWHANQYIVELTEVDSAILTDEMPIDVITDKGFDAWLRSSASH